MVWNPFRLLRTLAYFRAAGPLGQGLGAISELFNPMMSSSSSQTLVPTPLADTVAIIGLSSPQQERLRAVAPGLGYQVEMMPFGSDNGPNEGSLTLNSLVNMPLLLWSGAPSDTEGLSSLRHLAADLERTPAYSEARLVDWRYPTPALQALWGALDDVVMGGVSASQAQWQEALLFTGQVSTANSGGFASIRTRNLEPPMNLAQWQGIVLHGQGDGQRYKWILRDSSGWDSLAYCRSFDTTQNAPIAVRTSFLEMVATARARTVPQASPLNPAHVCSMQLMLSKFEYDGGLNPSFQPGTFRLAIWDMGVYREAAKPVVVLPGLDKPRAAEAQSILAEHNLVGVVPGDSGFKVIGQASTLPAWIQADTVRQLCQAM